MRSPALAVVFALLLAPTVPLRADVWLGAQGPSWSDNLNWQDSTAPTNGESVVFDSNTVTFATVLGADFTLHTLQVLDPVLPISITGGVLTIAGGTIDLSAGAAGLTIGSTLVLSNSMTWNVPASRQLTIAGPFASAAGPLTKTGDGTLVFAGAGIAYTGLTTISQGRLVLSNATSFARGAAPASFAIAADAVLEIAYTGTVALGSTATTLVTGAGTLLKTGPGLLGLDEQGGAQFVVAIRMSGGTIDVQGGTLRNGGWTGQQWTDGATWTNQAVLNVAAGAVFDVWDGLNPHVGALTGDGAVTKAQGVGTTRTLIVGTGDRSGAFSGTLTNAQPHLALTKVGAGTQTLAGVCLHTGDTTVNGGELELAAGSFIAASRILVNAGGLLRLTAGETIANTLDLRVSTNGGAGMIYVGAGLAETVGLFFVQGVIQPSGSHGATGSGATYTNDTIFTGPGLLVAALGSGMLSDGSWALDGSGEWSTPGNWTDGIMAFGTNRTARFTNAIAASRSVTNIFAPLDIGNLRFGSPANSWTLTGNDLRLVVDAGTPGVAVDSNTATFAAAITGSQGFAKTGPGTLVLTASNTYSGATTVGGGTLQFAGAGLVYRGGTEAGTIDVQGGATLSLARSDTFGNHAASPAVAVTVRQGGLLENAGAVGNTLRNLTLEGGELRANGGNAAQWGAYQLKGTVVATGSAPSRISATASVNQFTQIPLGDNTVNGATTFQVSDATGNAAPDLLIAAALANGRDVGGATLVPSRFIKTGTGTLLLGGNNVNTGPSSVDAGTLVVSGGVVNASIALAAGATLAAQEGPGLVGDYNHLGSTLPLTASFISPYALADHLATLSPSGLYNFPSNSPNFDFTGGGWPSVMPYTTNYEVRWEGTFHAPTSGVYYFSTASDDGSMIWIDGTNVVNNNAFQGTTTKSGTIALSAGPHAILIAYYQGTGGYTLQAQVALPGGTTNLLSRNLVTTPRQSERSPAPPAARWT
jgi:autotransporter-associated beta strand protein